MAFIFLLLEIWKFAKMSFEKEEKKLTYTSSDFQMYIAASHEHRKII